MMCMFMGKSDDCYFVLLTRMLISSLPVGLVGISWWMERILGPERPGGHNGHLA